MTERPEGWTPGTSSVPGFPATTGPIVSSNPTTLVLRPRIQRVDECLRPTRAEIDLDAIAHNLQVVRARVTPARVLAVVKADAYGHGVVPVALRLQEEGVAGFGVALAEEGIELRDAGVTSDIVVLNGVYGSAHADVLRAALTPVVYDLDQVRAFASAAESRPFGVHLKVDTGMGRLGVRPDLLPAFLEGLAAFPGVRVDGVMTHLASADHDDAFTDAQLDLFDRAVALIRAAGHDPRMLHAANSAGALRIPRARHDLVRAGIALFGLPGAPDVVLPLKQAMRLRSEVIALRTIEAGEGVGYDQTFRATRRTRVATVPLGYGDGLMRSNSNRGVALVRGRRCRLIGNVSMDLTTFDVTDVPEVVVGDEAVLLGEQGGDRICATEVADAAGTLPYEVWCAVSRRVPRFYT